MNKRSRTCNRKYNSINKCIKGIKCIDVIKRIKSENDMTREGSFTIELSLIMPLIIFVFLLILFLNYYVHDRIAIDKACYIAALRSANYPDEAERENIALTVLNREIPARLLWKWDYTEGVQVMADEVIVSFEGTMLVREGLINRYLSGKLFAYNASQSASVIDEDDYIRSL